eukprot:PhF_6_TR7095/c0_g1_i1/m.10720
MSYLQAPTINTPHPDRDFIISCCTTYLCLFPGCILYCIKPSVHTAWGIIGGIGLLLFLGGLSLTITAATLGDCDRSHFVVESDYKKCKDIVDAYRSRSLGTGIPCIIVGLICLPTALWHHKITKEETINRATVVVQQQPMVLMSQPVYRPPPPML